MTTAAEVALVATGALLVLTLLGVAILLHAPTFVRNAVWPAAPLVGFAGLALGLSTVGLMLPTATGVWLVLAIAAALGAWGWRRAGWAMVAGGTWRVSTAGWLLGLFPMLLAVAPLLVTGATLTRVTPNNDAFFYSSVIEWLKARTLLDVPDVRTDLSGDPVAFGPAVSAQDGHLRVGFELVHAALNAMWGTGPVTTWFTWTALAGLFAVGSTAAALSVLGLPRYAGLVVGLVVGTSTSIVYQVFNGNSPAALAAAMLPLVLTVSGAALRRSERDPPLWLAAVLLTGLAAVYTEAVLFIAPPLVVWFVVVHWRRPRRAVVTAALLGALCLVIAPYVWMRGAQYFAFLRGVETSPGSASGWVYGSVAETVGRQLGVGWPMISPESSHALVVTVFGLAAVLLPAALLVGILAMLRWSPFRVLYGSALVWFVGLLVWLDEAEQTYSLDRALMVTAPVFLFAAGVGWTSLGTRVNGTMARGGGAEGEKTERRRSLNEPAAWLTALALVAVATNATTVALYLKRVSEQFLPVDAEYAEAAGWTAEAASGGTSPVLVASGDFWQQLWLTYATRDQPNLGWPSLDPSYLRVSSHWNGTLGRWLLLDSGVVADVNPEAVVRSNDRFMLVDLRKTAAVAIPCCQSLTEWWPAEDLGGETVRRMIRDGGVTVLTSDRRDTVVGLSLDPQEALEPLTVTASGDDGGDAEFRLTLNGPGELRLDVPGGVSRWTLTAGAEPVSVDGGLTYSLILVGVQP